MVSIPLVNISQYLSRTRNSHFYNLVATQKARFFLEPPCIEVVGYSSGGCNNTGIPKIKVIFASGLIDEMILEPAFPGPNCSPCIFLGKLKDTAPTNVAVTGCLEKPGDKMEISMSLPQHGWVLTLDYGGQVTVHRTPCVHPPCNALENKTSICLFYAKCFHDC